MDYEIFDMTAWGKGASIDTTPDLNIERFVCVLFIQILVNKSRGHLRLRRRGGLSGKLREG